MRILIKFAAAILLAFVVTSPVAARPLEPERQAGLVGDQADGYLGIAGAASPAVTKEVEAINLERRSLYAKIAAEKGASVEAVGAIFGEQLFQQTPSGQLFRDATGAWIHKP